MPKHILTNSYHSENPLIVQFIFVEFLESFRLVAQIKSIVGNIDGFTQQIVQIFDQLINHQATSEISSREQGSLKKLQKLCEQLTRNSHDQNVNHNKLHTPVFHAWLYAIQAIKSIEKYIRLKHSLANLMSEIPQFALFLHYFDQAVTCLPSIMHAYWDNENVIFCLMRKKMELSKIYGVNFLKEHFGSPFSEEEIVKLLINKYQQRGFETMLPAIYHSCQVKDLS